MKALVLYQPWASLMAIGVKTNETRGRPWAYVGDVAICAAKQKLGQDVPDSYMPALRRLWEYRDRLGYYASNIRDLYYSLPFGQIVCVVEKTDCLSTNDHHGSLTATELDCGDYSPNRFYYPTRNLRRLTVPINVTGFQGPFTLQAELEQKILEQLMAQA